MPISPIDPPGPDPVSIMPLIERRGELRLSPAPLPLTPLIGREAEVAALTRLLAQPGVRLVTLTGPGGTGKTRLAVQLAAELRERYRDGIAFAGLATIRDPALVMAAIAESVGIREPETRSLVTVLRDRQLLLILDNVEHVLDAAPEVAALLSACPHVTVLATSRAPLRISGEHAFPAPPLLVPDPERLPPLEELSTASAVALFASRARAADPGFLLDDGNAAAVVEICTRLDGLPLAIELAASRSLLLSPQALLERMDRSLDVLGSGARDAPDRQRTMRVTIAWSFDLLPPSARELLERLAVFVGGFDLAGAETVAGQIEASVISDLELLLDHGMIRRQTDATGGRRFRIPETIREFALEQLDASRGTASARQAHAARFLNLAEQRELADLLPEGDRAMLLLETEQANFRAALTWLHDSGEGDSVARLAGALGRFWSQQGHYREGRAWLARAAASGNAASPGTLARAFVHLGMIELYQGDDQGAGSHLTQALAISREHGLVFPTTLALLGLGAIAATRNDPDRGTALLQESLAAAHTIPDRRVSGIMSGLVLGNLSDIARAQGNVELAASHSREGLQRLREAAHTVGLVLLLVQGGDLERDRGNLGQAADLYQQALIMSRELRGARVTVEAIQALGIVAIAAGSVERGIRLLGATDALQERMGLRHRLAESQAALQQAVAAARAELGDEPFAVAWSNGQTMTLDQVIAEAMVIAGSLPDSGGSHPKEVATVPPVPSNDGRQLITDREVEVLRLLVTGQTDREIAEILFISHATARSHVSSILRKLDVNSRTAAATYAFQHGLV